MQFFGATLSRGTPDALHASVLERRAKLGKKYGAPVVLEPTLAAAAGLWELECAKLYEKGRG